MSIHVATEGGGSSCNHVDPKRALLLLTSSSGTDYYVLEPSTLFLMPTWGGFLFLATKYVLKLNKFYQEIPLLIYFN